LELDRSWRQGYVIPDILVVCDKKQITKEGVSGPVPLVVEIVSLSNSAHDLSIKRRLYMSKGVSEYWMVEGRRFIRCVLDESGEDKLELLGSRIESVVFPGLVVDLSEVELIDEAEFV